MLPCIIIHFQILLVDLDNDHILRCIGDEGSILPKKIVKALSTALREDGGKNYSIPIKINSSAISINLVEPCNGV